MKLYSGVYVLSTLLLCACSRSGHAQASHGNAAAAPSIGAALPAEAGEAAVVFAEDDGKSFEVARGGTITFKLARSAGTGYAWVPTQVDGLMLEQQGERTSEISSDTPGGPKLDVYSFTANREGSTTVEMSLQRPFGNALPARVVHVAIHVH